MPSNESYTTNRRRFLGAAASAASYGRILGANERLQLGLIGCGERGRYDTSNFVKAGNVDVVALCDVWGDNLDRAKTAPSAANARTFADHRKLLEIKELDVALICVPDHWHVPIAIDALNAGKDVYVEKPLTLKAEEGPLVVKAARTNKRVCQVGMQQRSGKHYLQVGRQRAHARRLLPAPLAGLRHSAAVHRDRHARPVRREGEHRRRRFHRTGRCAPPRGRPRARQGRRGAPPQAA